MILDYEKTIPTENGSITISNFTYTEEEIMSNMLHNIDGGVLASALIKMGITVAALKNPSKFKLVHLEEDNKL